MHPPSHTHRTLLLFTMVRDWRVDSCVHVDTLPPRRRAPQQQSSVAAPNGRAGMSGAKTSIINNAQTPRAALTRLSPSESRHWR